MAIFTSSLNQMAFLFAVILVGYIIARLNVVNRDAATILSKLENYVFMPALVLSSFMKRMTYKTLKTSWQYLLLGFMVIVVSSLLATLISKAFPGEEYERKIYTYGLAFSNFGFMGNAVVSALFPDLFVNYLIFTLPFNFVLYTWAVPNLLIPSKGGKRGFIKRLKSLLNPLFFALITGSVIGLSGLTMPSFFTEAASSLGGCMSPVAMLLTGITIASMDLGKMFKKVPVYFASLIRLLVLPIAGIFLLKLTGLPRMLSLCAVCTLAMPLGLNTIVFPEAYGRDASLGASMALISHILSCITIPFVFFLFERVFG